VNVPSALIFGRIFEDGITQPNGADPSILAEVGLGPSASDPRAVSTWIFSGAQFNTQSGNDDEYMQTLTSPAAGTFSYTYRFSRDDGLTFTYCDLNGAGSNGGLDFETGQLGVLTVTP
jgi:hypothetical protein